MLSGGRGGQPRKRQTLQDESPLDGCTVPRGSGCRGLSPGRPELWPFVMLRWVLPLTSLASCGDHHVPSGRGN